MKKYKLKYLFIDLFIYFFYVHIFKVSQIILLFSSWNMKLEYLFMIIIIYLYIKALKIILLYIVIYFKCTWFIAGKFLLRLY